MRRPRLQYAIIAILFAMATLYQVRWISDTLKIVFYPDRFVGNTLVFEEGVPVLKDTPPEAEKAGLRNGDTLLAVDGKPFTGQVVLGRELAARRPGDVLTVTAETPQGQEKTAQITLQTYIDDSVAHDRPSAGTQFAVKALQLVLNIAMPVIALALGFWVVLARPRDFLAWLLLFVMIGFTQIVDVRIERWGDWMRYFAVGYHIAFNNLWPISMFLLGIYFPEPFPLKRARARFRLMAWIVLVPLAITAVLHVIAFYGVIENYAATRGIQHFLNSHIFIDNFLTFIAIGTFFGATGAKMRMATSRDAKRRLLLLYSGTSLALTPIFILTVIGLIRQRPVQDIAPGWVIVPALLLIALFPVTLAYAIVVQKAMDVRVVIRQGLQYALAKNGVRVLQVAVSAVVGVAAFTLAGDVHRNQAQKIGVIAGGAVVIFLLRRGAEKLRAWTDRRFFRDAYNAELILSELSETVRGFVESRPLLETVARTVAASLHVSRIAVMLNGSGSYRAAYAMGYEHPPQVAFLASAGTVTQLQKERQPVRIYLDDPHSWVNQTDGISEQERAQLSELEPELLLPLASRDHLLGFMSLGQKRSEEPYSGSDLRLLQSVASQTGLALENARLTTAIAQEVAQRERLNREIEIAREVQERLFPQQLPPIAGLDYSGKCRPALGVGGDYYDFLALAGGRLGIAIGDVSGKGISAALMMASLQASLRGQALTAPEDLAKLMANVNRLVYEASASNRYATFFYGQYDPSTGHFDYVNAGHNPPFILRAKNGVDRLEEGGTVVGLLAESAYRHGSARFERGDVFVAYTDGISEAMNSHDEEWGEGCLLQTVRSCTDLGADEMINRVISAADGFSAGEPQHDDMTLVILKAV